MKNFQYNNPARIIFGDGSEQEIGTLLNEYKVTSLLLIYSGDFIKDLGIWNAVHTACEENQIQLYECSKVVPNPRIELVRELVTLGKEKK